MLGLISPISSSMSVPRWAASNLPIFRSVAPVKAPFSWPNSSLSSRVSVSAAQLRQTNGVLAARAGVVDGAGDQFLADAAFAANQHGGLAGGGPGDFLGDLLHLRAAADDLALHAQPLAQLDVLVANELEVLGQLFATIEVVQRHGHRVGHGQGELQVVGIRAPGWRRSSRGE